VLGILEPAKRVKSKALWKGCDRGVYEVHLRASKKGQGQGNLEAVRLRRTRGTSIECRFRINAAIGFFAALISGP
jgi:hypothetical protein